LHEIKTNKKILQKYITELDNLCPANVYTIETHAHKLCPELDIYYKKNIDFFTVKNKNPKDKGIVGKYIEFSLFGNLPNNKNIHDLQNGYDVKTTHFHKSKKDGLYRAKQHITITNCGNRKNIQTFYCIGKSEELQECFHYNKIQKGILFIFDFKFPWTNDIIGNNTIYNIQNKQILSIFLYNLDLMSEIETKILNNDFLQIRNNIYNNTFDKIVTEYLQLYKHGSKTNPNTYALGFTNKFTTKLYEFFGKKK
jgi:hypothetical protein